MTIYYICTICDHSIRRGVSIGRHPGRVAHLHCWFRWHKRHLRDHREMESATNPVPGESVDGEKLPF